MRLTPLEGLRIDVSNQYGVNTFNTFYAEGGLPLAPARGLEAPPRRPVHRSARRGRRAAARGGGKVYWATQAGGARVQAIYRDLTLTGAFSITSAGNTIQNPWGSFPGYLSMIDQDFDRAKEKAILVGAAYDFEKLVRGLRANTNLVWGWDAINPSTGKKAPNQSGVRFHRRLSATLPSARPAGEGCGSASRSAILDQQDAKTLGYQFRIIINWDRDLI